MILAGHGIILSGAERDLVRQFAEKAHIPVAITLLGLGGIPASHPLNLGMMGMHGEAWVNNAIQEADLLLAFGMRFDDRVTGNLKTYAPNAKKIHIEIDPAEINKNVKVDVALVGDLARSARGAAAARRSERSLASGSSYIRELKGDSAVRDIQNLPDNGHLYAAHVINDLWRETNGDALVVTDVGQHQMWEAQYYHHDEPRSLITSGGLGTMGFALARCDRRQVRAPRRGSLGRRRRRRLPDDDVRARDHRAGKARHQHRDHQQRLSRHGAPVAGVLLREALRRHAAGQSGFREARRSLRNSRHARGSARAT